MSSIETLCQPMVKAFSKSIANTFEQMVFMPATVGEPLPKTEGTPTGGISGTIGLTGVHQNHETTELRAKLSLIFNEALAMSIFRSMMMMEPDAPVEVAELRDVVGELTNMTAGGAKTALSEDGFKLQLSLPSVAVGHDHYLCDTSGVAFSKVIPVDVEGGRFFCEISVS